jgi:hypothetical protein
MDLIDRYLAAVAIFLPPQQKDDITAELRDELVSRREDRAAELGRPLSRQEDEDLLRAFGRPVLVAARYGANRYLIGPELYPLYILILKIVLACMAGAALIIGVITATAYGDPGDAVSSGLNVFWNGVFGAVGIVTLIFAAFEHAPGQGLKALTDWNPRDLPRPTRRRQPGWFDHVAAIVVQSLFVLWWTRVIRLWNPLLPLSGGRSLHLDLAPVWQELYWPVIALSIAVILVNGVKLMRRAGELLARGLDLSLQLATLGLAAVALAAGHWVTIAGVGLDGAALAKVDRGVNIGAEVTLITIVCVAAATGAWDLWRISRLHDDR